MKFLLVHLSDIHFDENRVKNPILSKCDEIAKVILSYSKTIKELIIVVSGDISFSGKEKEYEIAINFLNKIISEINKKDKININVITIPGNHDCLFENDDSVRELLLKGINPEDVNDLIIEKITLPQNNYFKFNNKFTNYEIDSISERIFKSLEIEISGESIFLNLINSAWMSSLHEIQGKIFFPLDYLHFDDLKKTEKSVVISIVHHPKPWYESENGRLLFDILEKNSDIVITGHQHSDGVYFKSDINSGSVEYIEGGVLQENGGLIRSSFNVFVVDTIEKYQDTYKFKLTPEGYYRESGDHSKNVFIRNKRRMDIFFELKEGFNKNLHDIGTTFSHPNCDEIDLQDIFVYPDFKPGKVIEESKSDKREKEKNISEFILENHNVHIIGQEKCGKTTLSKKIFLDLSEKSVLPLLITGDNFKKTEKDFTKIIKRAITHEYENTDYDKFFQDSKHQKAIIIDDFDKSGLDIKNRDILLEQYERLFDYVVIIEDSNSQIELVMINERLNSKIVDYAKCVLMEFGHQKREELIERWYKLGDHDYESLLNDEKKIINSVRLINSLLGKNFVPSYPIFILAFQNQIELGTPINPALTTGSYGFLYESILTLSLLRASIKDIELDTQYNYLSEFAFYLFRNKKKRITDEESYYWHQEFCKDYQLVIDFRNIQKLLHNASILINDNGYVKFKYPYLYYYFVARYIKDHITENDIQDQIIKMSKKLYQSEAANIILFICYLSKDPFIIKTIISESKKFFVESSEFNIIEDTEFLWKNFDELPKLTLPSTDPKINRTEINKRRDELDEINLDEDDKGTEDEIFDVDDDPENEFIEKSSEINSALKTVQILGQILRNYYGSLKGVQKEEIARETYSLGLRVLGFIFSSVKVNYEEMINQLSEKIHEIDPEQSMEVIAKQTCRSIDYLMETISYIVIKHISDSVGHEKLALTYDQLLRNDENISYRFVDIAIKLDYYFHKFPEDEIDELHKEANKSAFATNYLRQLIRNHFYLYQTNHIIKEKMCKKFLIETVSYDNKKY